MKNRNIIAVLALVVACATVANSSHAMLRYAARAFGMPAIRTAATSAAVAVPKAKLSGKVKLAWAASLVGAATSGFVLFPITMGPITVRGQGDIIYNLRQKKDRLKELEYQKKLVAYWKERPIKLVDEPPYSVFRPTIARELQRQGIEKYEWLYNKAVEKKQPLDRENDISVDLEQEMSELRKEIIRLEALNDQCERKSLGLL